MKIHHWHSNRAISSAYFSPFTILNLLLIIHSHKFFALSQLKILKCNRLVNISSLLLWITFRWNVDLFIFLHDFFSFATFFLFLSLFWPSLLSSIFFERRLFTLLLLFFFASPAITLFTKLNFFLFFWKHSLTHKKSFSK